jgi:CheY-like chemotaxis protein
MDGLEAARIHRARGGRTPLIALTANAFEEDRRACLDAGMDDFLTKPLDPDRLRAAVARWTQTPTQDKLAS